MNHVNAVRVPLALYEDIRDIARTEGLSENHLVYSIIDSFLDAPDHLRRIQDYDPFAFANKRQFDTADMPGYLSDKLRQLVKDCGARGDEVDPSIIVSASIIWRLDQEAGLDATPVTIPAASSAITFVPSSAARATAKKLRL